MFAILEKYKDELIMEKFFVISSESSIYMQCKSYFVFLQRIEKVFIGFAKEHNIESTNFGPYTNRLIFAPTEQDDLNFNQYFLVNHPGVFKKNAPLSKAWVALCKKQDIEEVREPNIPWYVYPIGNRLSWTYFFAEETLYLRISSDVDFKAPSDWREISGSRYYQEKEREEDIVVP